MILRPRSGATVAPVSHTAGFANSLRNALIEVHSRGELVVRGVPNLIDAVEVNHVCAGRGAVGSTMACKFGSRANLAPVQASGWHNGTPRSSGAGYGIRISKADRDRYFVPGWDNVRLEFPDGQRVEVELTRSFWKPETVSAELRDAAIGRWLIAQGAAPWPKGSPPRLVLAALGPKCFSVTPSD